MNCWDCGLNKSGGIPLCSWFNEPKEVPPHIIDKGCKFWRSKFAQLAIEKFDGELIL
jgi:hypothetical protein